MRVGYRSGLAWRLMARALVVVPAMAPGPSLHSLRRNPWTS